MKIPVIFALIFSAAVITLTFFWPMVGLIVPVIAFTAAMSTLFKKNWFCSSACPRGRILSGFLPRISRYRPLPKFLYSENLRKLLCGFMLFCSIGQTMRLRTDLESLGWFFWGVCIFTLAASVILGIFYKPRAWCALCPVGILQRTIRPK